MVFWWGRKRAAAPITVAGLALASVKLNDPLIGTETAIQ